MLRDFYNSVLAFIETESLTDEEFESCPQDLESAYTKETFEALKAILASRESVSDKYRRLYNIFRAAGVDDLGEKKHKAISNIFIGSPLS